MLPKQIKAIKNNVHILCLILDCMWFQQPHCMLHEANKPCYWCYVTLHSRWQVKYMNNADTLNVQIDAPDEVEILSCMVPSILKCHWYYTIPGNGCDMTSVQSSSVRDTFHGNGKWADYADSTKAFQYGWLYRLVIFMLSVQCSL